MLMDMGEHLDIGGSNTSSEGIGEHLKRWKGEDIETENICNVKELL